MKVITIPSEEKTLNALLKKAEHTGLILQSAGGQRFVLTSIDENWEGFEVGNGDDFDREVTLTGQNEALLAFLAKRRSHNKRISLAEAKKQLGLEE
jgi:hypothetical protein